MDLKQDPGHFAVAGDWHGNLNWARAQIARVADAGIKLIIQLGDFGFWNEPEVNRLNGSLESHDVDLMFVDGNHENFPYLYSVPVGEDGLRHLSDRVHHIPRGFRWEWGGTRLMGLGGASSVDKPYRTPGYDWFPEETLTDRDMEYAMRLGGVDVLFSHDVPSGVPVPGIDDRSDQPMWGSAELAAAAEHRIRIRLVTNNVRPKIIFHGHYHRRYWWIGADLGYGPVTVQGMNCDGGDGNLLMVHDLPALITEGFLRKATHAPD